MQRRENLNRRDFVQTAAAGVAAASAITAITAPATIRADDGANRLRIGFIGPGRRGFGAHVRSLVTLHGEGAPIDLVAVNDVYTVHRDRAVNFIEEKTGLRPDTYDDYRDMLQKADLDVVCIATPDHWHAKQTIDSLRAGKHVYCEKPMTHTIDEAFAVIDAWRSSGRVMQVGVQSTSMPIWDQMRAMVNAGQLGKIVQFQTESARNSLAGMSRHNIITKEMTPRTIDWKQWLGLEHGLAPDLPFDRATYGQWRCYWPFGYGMYTDLFVHRITTMLKATGLSYPGRVTGGGGIFLEYDDRDVADMATIVADFPEGAQGLISSSMVSEAVPLQHVIRGHHGSILFDRALFGQKQTFEFIPERPQVTLDSSLKRETFNPPHTKNQDLAHFSNFLAAIRTDDPALVNNSPDLGAAALVIANLATRSYREGRVFHFDATTRKVSDGDSSWADRWEQMSKARSKPNHVPGWQAGDRGSLLVPHEYQKLAGPWIDGRPPEAG
jgi:predicted dehydrogenase